MSETESGAAGKGGAAGLPGRARPRSRRAPAAMRERCRRRERRRPGRSSGPARLIGGNDLEPEPRPEEGKAADNVPVAPPPRLRPLQAGRPRRGVGQGRQPPPLAFPGGVRAAAWGVSPRAGTAAVAGGGGGGNGARCGAQPRGAPHPLRSCRGS